MGTRLNRDTSKLISSDLAARSGCRYFGLSRPLSECRPVISLLELKVIACLPLGTVMSDRITDAFVDFAALRLSSIAFVLSCCVRFWCETGAVRKCLRPARLWYLVRRAAATIWGRTP
jgi:hypothetical protein